LNKPFTLAFLSPRSGSLSKNGFRIGLITHDLNLVYTQVSPLLLAFGYLPSEKGVYELNDRSTLPRREFHEGVKSSVDK